jgi:putative drug exporter of the RND superfamily
MLVLLLAELQSTHWLGPILAIGIAAMLAASFTLLPAVLSLLGRAAFWPARGFGAAEGRRRWERVAGLVRRRARPIVAVVFACLAFLALGNLVDHGTIGFGQGETRPTESSRGTEALDAHFPPGLSSPLTVVAAERYFSPVLRRLESLPSVKLASPGPPSTSSDQIAFAVILRGSPFSSGASDAVQRIRERLHEVDPGALVGGIPAENLDVETTNARDTKLILPAVLIVGSDRCHGGNRRPARHLHRAGAARSRADLPVG